MSRRIEFWTVFAVVAYVIIFFLSYRAMELGQVALLDAREQQVLAKQMATGTLPAEPYYRAPLYAGVLSVFYRVGLNDEGVLLAGQLTNLFLHLLAGLAIYGAALKLWNKRYGALLAAGLYGAYPVALYLAGDLLDTTLAQAIVGVGIYFTVCARGGLRTAEPLKNQKAQKSKNFLLINALISGGMLGMGILARPQLAAVAVGVFLFLLIGVVQKNSPRRVVLGFLLGILAVLMVFGLSEKLRTGVFYVLPTQGSYNLWSANRPGATGEYFSQRMELPALAEGENPAHAEALVLYRKLTGDEKAVSQACVDEYWRGQFFRYLQQHPSEVVVLYGYKLRTLLGDREVYNNKTYSYQKSLNPALKYNPLGFLSISLLALFTLLFYRPMPKVIWGVLGVAIVYALGAAIFYSGDRFRLVLVPFVLLIVAGLPSAMLQLWGRFSKEPKAKLAAKLFLLIAWGVVFGGAFEKKGRDTSVADKLLIAQAQLKAGADLSAEKTALGIIDSGEKSQAAVECLLQARYNNLIKGSMDIDAQWCREQIALGETLTDPSGEVRYILGLCQWRLSRKVELWRQLVQESSGRAAENALAGLLACNVSLSGQEVLKLRQLDRQASLPILLSRAVRGDARAQEALEKVLGKAAAAIQIKRWRGLFL